MSPKETPWHPPETSQDEASDRKRPLGAQPQRSGPSWTARPHQDWTGIGIWIRREPPTGVRVPPSSNSRREMPWTISRDQPPYGDPGQPGIYARHKKIRTRERPASNGIPKPGVMPLWFDLTSTHGPKTPSRRPCCRQSEPDLETPMQRSSDRWDALESDINEPDFE